MAGINRVEFGNNVIIDLTEDTVTPDTLVTGFTAHDRNGDIITGRFSGGGASNIDDTAGKGDFTVVWSADKSWKETNKSIDYNGDRIINKPKLGALSSLEKLDYESDLLINKPGNFTNVLTQIIKYMSGVPYELMLAVNIMQEILCLQDSFAEYVSDNELVILHNGNILTFSYDPEEVLIIQLSHQNGFVEEAPLDGQFYIRQSGNWVPVQLNQL